MSKKVRTRFQPTVEVEMDDAEAAAHEHQGLLWSGTDAELADLCEAAGLPAPAATPPTPAAAVKTAVATGAGTTDKKEGA